MVIFEEKHEWLENLSSILDKSIETIPGSAALGLADLSIVLSNIELKQNILSCADKLRELGIKPGDAVSITLTNSIEFVVAFLAVTSVRATAAPLNNTYKEEEFEFYFKDQEAVVVIDHAGDNSSGVVRNAAGKLNIPVWEAEMTAKREVLISGDAVGVSAAKEDVHPEDIALFLHTSGTTSRPKGVPLSHRNLVASISNIMNTYKLSPSDSTVLVMPLFHVHGLMCGLMSSLAAGCAVYIPKCGKFSATDFWKEIVQCKATWYTAVPTIHQILIARADSDYPKSNPPNLRFIRSCSASLAPALLNKIEQTFKAPVLEAYAMTEAAHQMTSNPLPERGCHKAGTVGLGQNVEIVILNADLEILSPGEIGEVCIKGKNVIKGYHKNPAATKEAFAGGWFHTGDQGFLDEDGYLKLTGRLKELINRGGEKISPIEIDSVLMSHPDIAEAVCFAAPDAKYGEEVNAAVICKQSGVLSEEDIQKFCLTKLADFKIPKKIFFTETLPRTGSGKIQRRKVAEFFLTS